MAAIVDSQRLTGSRICLRLGMPMTALVDVKDGLERGIAKTQRTDERLQTIIAPMMSLATVTQNVLDALNTLSTIETDPGNRLVLVDLNRQLEEWRRSLSVSIPSLYESNQMPRSSDPAQICLRICYYQVLLLINRTSIPQMPQESRDHAQFSSDSRCLSTLSEGSPEFRICVDAARESIKLVQDIPVEYSGFLRSVAMVVNTLVPRGVSSHRC